MGIVASLAAIPVAEDIIRDEKRRELQRLEEERLRRMRDSGYRHGDIDLQIIKRLSVDIGANEEILGPESSKFREGHTKVSDVEKIYLTGPYKQKYKTLSDFYNSTPCKRLYPVLEWSGNYYGNTNGGRKIRSAYPNVRLRSAQLTHHTGNNQHYHHLSHSNAQSPSRISSSAVVKEITVKNAFS